MHAVHTYMDGWMSVELTPACMQYIHTGTVHTYMDGWMNEWVLRARGWASYSKQ